MSFEGFPGLTPAARDVRRPCRIVIPVNASVATLALAGLRDLARTLPADSRLRGLLLGAVIEGDH